MKNCVSDDYVNPRSCLHQHVRCCDFGTDQIFAFCPVCHLQGEAVNKWSGIGSILNKGRALRKFYQLANKVDRGI